MKTNKTLIVPIGISGSGKSRYFNKRLLIDFPEIAKRLNELNLSVEDIVSCPDEIRKEVLGNVNDQSNGALIWEIAKERVIEKLSKIGYAIIDGVNTHGGTRNKFLKDFKNTRKIALVFRPKIDVCFERISNDIKNNVNRSNVPLESIKRQYSNFKNSLIRDEKWDGLWNKTIKEKIVKNLTEERKFHEVRFID